MRIEAGHRGQVENRNSMREPLKIMAMVVGIVLLCSAATLVLRPPLERATRLPPLPLAIVVGALLGLLAGLTGTQLDTPYRPGGWTVRLASAIYDEPAALDPGHDVERIEAFRANGCTILFCSHSLYHVRQLCDVALWLDGGTQRACGPTERVLAAYAQGAYDLASSLKLTGGLRAAASSG